MPLGEGLISGSGPSPRKWALRGIRGTLGGEGPPSGIRPSPKDRQTFPKLPVDLPRGPGWWPAGGSGVRLAELFYCLVLSAPAGGLAVRGPTHVGLRCRGPWGGCVGRLAHRAFGGKTAGCGREGIFSALTAVPLQAPPGRRFPVKPGMTGGLGDSRSSRE